MKLWINYSGNVDQVNLFILYLNVLYIILCNKKGLFDNIHWFEDLELKKCKSYCPFYLDLVLCCHLSVLPFVTIWRLWTGKSSKSYCPFCLDHALCCHHHVFLYVNPSVIVPQKPFKQPVYSANPCWLNTAFWKVLFPVAGQGCKRCSISLTGGGVHQ